MADKKMLTCGDCIHADICEHIHNLVLFNRKNAALCLSFKDKSALVEVVRCKDCKWMSRSKENNRAYCHGHIGVTIETAVNGYCYLGERKYDERKTD